MAFFDECKPGDTCTVTDLRTGTTHHGKILRLMPDKTRGPDSRVIVRYDGAGAPTVSVDPGFVTLDVGEADVEGPGLSDLRKLL